MSAKENCSANGKKAAVVKFATLDAKIRNLLVEATQAREFSYSPYSKFKVGACVLAESGKTYRGCNVENSAFTVGTCAERTAYFKAISEGERTFKALAVVAFQEKWFTTPCGACRQLMSEFGNVDVYVGKPKLEEVLVASLDEMMPFMFERNDDCSF